MKPETYHLLGQIGFPFYLCKPLARIATTLQRWHEGQCGTERGCIQENDDGTFSFQPATGAAYSIPDRKSAALKRLEKLRIDSGVPDLLFEIQGDPRGCPLIAHYGIMRIAII